MNDTSDSPFARIVAHVLDLEGGYVDDPDDRGGETKFGISKRSYPDVDIAALSVDDAIAIYRSDYWSASRCDHLPAAVACFVFDAAIQHGPRRGARMLQRALGVDDDGIIGPVTIGAAEQADPRALLADLFTARLDTYARLAEEPSQAKFRAGWFRRMTALQQFIYLELETLHAW